MDKQQRSSMIGHISQKIFINKVSNTDFSALNQQQETKKMRDIAGEAFIAAKFYVDELQLDLEIKDTKNETDLSFKI